MAPWFFCPLHVMLLALPPPVSLSLVRYGVNSSFLLDFPLDCLALVRILLYCLPKFFTASFSCFMYVTALSIQVSFAQELCLSMFTLLLLLFFLSFLAFFCSFFFSFLAFFFSFLAAFLAFFLFFLSLFLPAPLALFFLLFFFFNPFSFFAALLGDIFPLLVLSILLAPLCAVLPPLLLVVSLFLSVPLLLRLFKVPSLLVFLSLLLQALALALALALARISSSHFPKLGKLCHTLLLA